MASNVRFAYDFDTWDGATLSESSEEANLPVENIQDKFVSKVWRTTDDTDENVVIDLGSATNIKMVGIFNHNLTSGATITLQANTSDLWDSPAYSQTLTYNSYKIIYFLNQTYRYWRIRLQDASNSDGYIEIGRIVGGIYLEPTYNISDGFTKELVDPSYKKPVEGQEFYSTLRTKYWVYTLPWRYLTRTVQDDLQDVFETVGNTERFVISLDPDNYPSKDSIYCCIGSSFPLSNRFQDYADLGLRFIEQV